MTPPFEILVATQNSGKIREVRQALQFLSLKMRYLDEFSNVSIVNEFGQTYRENAALKALGYARQTGLCALADDSGLEVDALGGEPGVFSARFGGDDASDRDRIRELLTLMSRKQSAGRSARFVCCMALAGWPPGQAPIHTGDPQLLLVTEAQCDGAIATEPQGVNGFGFDPLFVPEGYVKTFAALPSEVKAKISHRAKALDAVRKFLSCGLPQT